MLLVYMFWRMEVHIAMDYGARRTHSFTIMEQSCRHEGRDGKLVSYYCSLSKIYHGMHRHIASRHQCTHSTTIVVVASAVVKQCPAGSQVPVWTLKTFRVQIKYMWRHSPKWPTGGRSFLPRHGPVQRGGQVARRYSCQPQYLPFSTLRGLDRVFPRPRSMASIAA
jgi:hypothetical protein